MNRSRACVHAICLVLLPLIVATFGLGVLTTVLLVLLMLLWRWGIVLSGLVKPEKGPAIVLETISASHFVEKVRWCMDRLGIDYTERQSGGALGVFFTGRTVPQLRLRTGLVETVIGDSPDVLRYIWATHHAADPAGSAFLEPTAQRVDFERRLDRYARNLQVWIYFHLLDKRALTLRAWGIGNPGVPAWHKGALHVLFPVLRALMRFSFRIDNDHYADSVRHIERMLADVDARLADGRGSILGGDVINYTDIAFASFCGLWMQVPGYGGGQADSERIAADEMPASMAADVQRWLNNYPGVEVFVRQLYDLERHGASA